MKRFILLFLIAFAFFSQKADAQFKNYKIKGGIQYQQLLPFTEYGSAYSFLGRGFINFELSNLISIEVSGGFGQIKTNDDFHTTTGTTATSSDNFVKAEIIPVDARVKFTPWSLTAKNWNPYMYIGAGILHYKVTELPAISIPEYSRPMYGYTGYIPVGIGTEIRMGRNVLLDLQAGVSYSLTDELNNFVLGSWEDAYGHIGLGLTFAGNDDSNLDNDKDGLTNGKEEQIGTDPNNPDTDGDGLNDGAEVNTYSTNPLNRDTDGDTLTDGDEVLKYNTNPLSKDTDNDRLMDNEEVMTYMTLPNDSDTDDDNLLDGDEVLTHKTDPKMFDTDLGTVWDGVEVGRGTNPLDPNDDLPPAPVEEPIKIGTVIVLEGINFASGSYDIDAGSDDILEKAYLSMANHPEIVVEISGHTDSRGGRDMNMTLSKNRAEAVKQWLVNKGISASRIETQGYGPDQPRASNDTEDGRYQNRRIEFKRIR